jgi:MFS family permease
VKRPPSLVGIFLVLFADLVGFSILFPLFPAMLTWYQATDTGLLAWMMGLVEQVMPGQDPHQRAALFGGLLGAVYAGLQFIAAPLWGRISDRRGRRPILLVSLTGSFLANLLWIFAGDFTLLLLSRVLAGAMSGNVAVANAAVADITTTENRSKGMAAVGMAFGVGFIVGPAVGGLLASVRIDTPALAAWGMNPFSVPAMAAFALAAVNLWWAWSRFAETLPPERRNQGGEGRPFNPIAVFWNDLPPRVHAVNIAGCLYTLLFAGMEITLGFLAAQRLGMGTMALGLLLAWTGVLSAATQGILVRRHGQRFGMVRLTMAGFLFHSVGLAVVGLVDPWPSHALLWLGMTIQSIGIGLVFPGLSTLVSLAAPPDRQGFAMGTYRSASSIGRAVGPLLGAVAYFAIGPWAPYGIAAVGMLIPFVLVRRLGR